MRLGLNWLPIRTCEELEASLPVSDDLGLGTVAPPREMMTEWSLERCERYEATVRDYGLTVGEIFSAGNLLIKDTDNRSERIAAVRSL